MVAVNVNALKLTILQVPHWKAYLVYKLPQANPVGATVAARLWGNLDKMSTLDRPLNVKMLKATLERSRYV